MGAAATSRPAHTDRVSTCSTGVMWTPVIRPSAPSGGKERDPICPASLSSGLGQLGSLSQARFCMGAQKTARHKEGFVSDSDSQRIPPSFNYRQGKSAASSKKLMAKP